MRARALSIRERFYSGDKVQWESCINMRAGGHRAAKSTLLWRGAASKEESRGPAGFLGMAPDGGSGLMGDGIRACLSLPEVGKK